MSEDREQGRVTKGNQNAAKPEEKKAMSRIEFRLNGRKKAAYTAAAQDEGMKLTAWIIEKLDAEAKDFYRE